MQLLYYNPKSIGTRKPAQVEFVMAEMLYYPNHVCWKQLYACTHLSPEANPCGHVLVSQSSMEIHQIVQKNRGFPPCSSMTGKLDT